MKTNNYLAYWKKISLFYILGVFINACVFTSDDLIISEFTAGTADQPSALCDDLNGGGQSACRSYAVEILNPTQMSIDMSDYALLWRFNSFAWGASDSDCSVPSGSANTLNGVPAFFCDRLSLTGSLATEKTQIVSRDSYDPNLISPQYLWSRFLYDGNDAIGLAKKRSAYNDNSCLFNAITVSFTPSGGATENWCIIDLFGSDEVPDLPYTIAGTSNRATLDVFRRLPSIAMGNTNWLSSAGSASSSEWIVVTTTSEGSRDYTNFGSKTPPISSTSNN